MIPGRIGCELAVLTVLCVLIVFFFPVMQGPFSVVHGPATALQGARAADRHHAGGPELPGELADFSVVLASATSWVVLRLLLGNNPLFKVPQYQLVHPLEFAIYALLGIAGGLVSVAFTKLLLGMRERFLRFPQETLWLQPLAGGLLVGLMGLVVPQVLGVGYGYVGDALNGTMALKLMLVLVVLKLLAVATSYASGNAGGIFGPSLFIRFMPGGAVGTGAHHLFPAYTATPGAYALVGIVTLRDVLDSYGISPTDRA